MDMPLVMVTIPMIPVWIIYNNSLDAIAQEEKHLVEVKKENVFQKTKEGLVNLNRFGSYPKRLRQMFLRVISRVGLLARIGWSRF